jgi:carbamoyl-phosphate synthase large subunit
MKIAVTGLNNTDNPGPGVPVIRSILAHPEFEGEIIGLHYDNLEPGIYMDGIKSRSYMIPYPSQGPEILLERLKYIHAKEKIDIILPTLDSELYNFIYIQDELKNLGIQSFLPTLENLEKRSKDKLSEFCESAGIDTPKTFIINSQSQIYEVLKSLKFPVVVKGIFYEAYISYSIDEVMGNFAKIVSKWGLPVLIQEYLVGDELNVAAVGDGEGNTLGAVAMRKLFITEKGKGWSGITIKDDNLLDMTRKVIQALKWRSGLELEILKARDSGKYYLLEINSRLPAWVYLTQAAGQNLPYLLVKLAKGENVEPYQEYEIGKMFIRCSIDLISDIKTYEQISINGEL